MQFDRDKFKALVHYVIWRAGGRDGIGATKLYKVLWFAEARAFVLSNRPISGETYIREEDGPSPRHAAEITMARERGGHSALERSTITDAALHGAASPMHRR